MRLPIRLLISSLLLAGMLSVSGCSAPKVSYTVPEGEAEQIVRMQAENFNFEPNEILTSAGSVLLLEIANTAGVDHNLTVEDPMGNHLLERELPSGRTISTMLRLSKSGTYEFYCDKPLHSTFGMTGRIVVH